MHDYLAVTTTFKSDVTSKSSKSTLPSQVCASVVPDLDDRRVVWSSVTRPYAAELQPMKSLVA